MISNYTIGVEEEYMLCDNVGDLANKANFLMKNLPKNLLDRYSYELILSEFESNTSIHDNVSDCLSKLVVISLPCLSQSYAVVNIESNIFNFKFIF